MSNTKFTSGEWFIVDSTDKSSSVWASESECITTINYNFWDEKYQTELKANAHLIAAAPAMYAMLEDSRTMLKAFHNNTGSMGAIAQVRLIDDLLKSARGES